MTIGAGLVERADDGRLYNSYVVAMPDGSGHAHRKLHAFDQRVISQRRPSTRCSTRRTVAASAC